MTIHHATIKRATEAGVSLVEEFDEDTGNTNVRASVQQPTVVLSFSDAKTALDAAILERMFRLEYPALNLISDGGDVVIFAQTMGDDYDMHDTTIYRGDKVPTIAFVLEACDNLDVDPEEGEAEETPSGNVVPDKYKALYRERGNASNCGDWLAKHLDGAFNSVDGNFDADLFTAFLVENGVELVGKWANLPQSGQKGWVGRYRMNGRQKLEQALIETGELRRECLGHKAIKVPADFKAFLLERHPPKKAKTKKAEKAEA